MQGKIIRTFLGLMMSYIMVFPVPSKALSFDEISFFSRHATKAEVVSIAKNTASSIWCSLDTVFSYFGFSTCTQVPLLPPALSTKPVEKKVSTTPVVQVITKRVSPIVYTTNNNITSITGVTSEYLEKRLYEFRSTIAVGSLDPNPQAVYVQSGGNNAPSGGVSTQVFNVLSDRVNALEASSTVSTFSTSTTRGVFSSTATGLAYDNSTGVFLLTSGYNIPLTASTTEWASAYINRITSASSPLSITGNNITISLASSTANGYLSSTDWSTFFGKQDLISSGTTGQYYRGDKTFQTLDTSVVVENGNLYFTNTRADTRADVRFFTNLSGTTTDALSQGSTNKYFSNTLARLAFSSSATGLSYDNSTGIFSLTSGYNIPLTASTTEWASAYASTTNLTTFYQTPSTRITAGTGLSWAGNTLSNTGVTSIGGFTGAVSTSSLGISGSKWTTTGSDISYSTGNVGIGTTTPGSPLTVVGTGLFTGNITTNSILNILGTGTSTITSDILLSGDIVPSADNTYRLGTPTKMWRDVYIGPGSLYVNGQKVLQTDGSNNVTVTADINQNLVLKTTGTGDLELNPSGTGQILLKGNLRLTAGKTITSSDSSAIPFSNGVDGGNLRISSNTLTATNLNGGISIAATGTGGVYVTSGNFGIGTTSPGSPLTVTGAGLFTGNVTADSYFGDGSNLTGITSFSTSTTRGVFSSTATGLLYDNSTGIFSLTSGYNIPLTASTTEWASKVSSQWTTSGSSVTYGGGNVGVGTTSPVSLFSVGGNSFFAGNSTTTGTVSASILNLTSSGGNGNSVIRFSNDNNSGFTYTNGGVGVLHAGSRMHWLGSTIDTTGGISFNSGSPGSGAHDISLVRDAAGVLAQRKTTTAQSFRIYNTYTSATDYERGAFNWTSNIFTIGTENSGNGSSRALAFMTASTTRMTIDTSGNVGIGTSSPAALLSLNAGTNSVVSPALFNLGTITDSTSRPFSMMQTWNSSGSTFQALNVDITNTASLAPVYNNGVEGSRILRIRVGGSTKMSLDTSGYLALPFTGALMFSDNSSNASIRGTSLGITTNVGGSVAFSVDDHAITTSAAGYIGWGASGSAHSDYSSANDVRLYRDAASTLALRTTTTAQNFKIYNTYTSASNYERGAFNWTNNIFTIGTENASGTARSLAFMTASTTRMIIDTSGNIGIGTTTPFEILTVVGNIYATGTLSAASSTFTNFTAGSVPFFGTGGVLAQNNTNFFWNNTTARLGLGVSANTTTNALDVIHSDGSTPVTLNVQNSIGNATGVAQIMLGTRNTAGDLNVGAMIKAIRTDTGSGGTSDITFGVSTGTTMTERMRIKGSGNVGIGTVSPLFILDTQTSSTTGYVARIYNTGNSSTAHGLIVRAGDSVTGGATLVDFQRGDGTGIGSITQNAVIGVMYNTTSDRRAKENIIETHYGLDDLLKVEIRDYNFISDPQKKVSTGFIAQDLFNVYPEAVSKPADETTRQWAVDYGRMTPLIIKGVQDLASTTFAIRDLDSSHVAGQTFISKMISWLGDATNGIGTLFVGKVQTKELCIDDVCVTKDQLIKVLQMTHTTPVPSSPTPTQTPIVPITSDVSDGDTETSVPPTPPVEDVFVAEEEIEEVETVVPPVDVVVPEPIPEPVPEPVVQE